jgi:hypothetical protein
MITRLDHPSPARNHKSLCVPKTSSTLCDLRVFVDDATQAVTPPHVELI